MKNAGVKVLVLSFVFVFMFSSLAYAMSWEEFIEAYPNEHIYKIVYPIGDSYISSPVELEFGLSDTTVEGELASGKAFVIHNPTRATYHVLNISGVVRSYARYEHEIVRDPSQNLGFEGNIDIYKWNGSSFFLPLALTFLRGLVGPTRTILLVGFGILSVSLLIRLLTVYFRRFLYRST